MHARPPRSAETGREREDDQPKKYCESWRRRLEGTNAVRTKSKAGSWPKLIRRYRKWNTSTKRNLTPDLRKVRNGDRVRTTQNGEMEDSAKLHSTERSPRLLKKRNDPSSGTSRRPGTSSSYSFEKREPTLSTIRISRDTPPGFVEEKTAQQLAQWREVGRL